MPNGLVVEYREPRPGCDSRDVHVNGKFVGFSSVVDDFVKVQRCFECGKSNWAMAVNSGVCCWCGWDANEQYSQTEGE